MKKRWAFEWPPGTPGVEGADADEAAAQQVLDGAPQDDGVLVPAEGRALVLVCDRRGHTLGAVFNTDRGPLAWLLYKSGRRTRRMPDGSVLATLKYKQARPFLLLGALSGTSARCDCTEIELSATERHLLAELARSRAGRVSLPSALCRNG